jgi:hypothetical protein
MIDTNNLITLNSQSQYKIDYYIITLYVPQHKIFLKTFLYYETYISQFSIFFSWTCVSIHAHPIYSAIVFCNGNR